MPTKTKHFIACATLLWLAHAQAAVAAPRNLAFDDDFVWYVAGRLATQLGSVVKSSGVKLEAADEAQFRGDWSLLYHHALIECKGPLRQINKAIVGYEIPGPNEKDIASPLLYVGNADDLIWPIVTLWELSVRKDILERFASGKFSTNFPECLLPEYRAQNPIPQR